MTVPTTFSDREIEALIADALTAITHPAGRKSPSERRLQYLSNAATEVLSRLRVAVDDGDIGRYELPVVLLGTALASFKLAQMQIHNDHRGRNDQAENTADRS